MAKKSFWDKLNVKWNQGKFVCVGLDPHYSKLPQGKTIFDFNKWIIDQTADLVCVYKPNSAFYEAEGVMGRRALEKTVKYLKERYPDIPTILDAKRADIGTTNIGYVKDIFDNLGFDAVTVHPYLGKEAVQPFLERQDRGIFVLVKTSNPGASEFQNLKIAPLKKPLYKIVAERVANDWNKYKNVGVVVGATYPDELKEVRRIVGDMPILIPGVGAQGGDVKMTVEAGKNRQKTGIIISSSRGIIFAKDPRKATLKLHEEIVSSLRL